MVDRVKYRFSDLIDQFICGDAFAELKAFPDECVDMIVTSPPYYHQRDYGQPGQLGSESSHRDYVDNLVRIFRECRRVLKGSGTLWLNMGDKYSEGNLLGLPWRLALRMQDDLGFILRSDIIWHKPNAMPTSVKNRPTTDHEYVFLFSKMNKYYYNADAIREPHITFTDESRMKGGRGHFGKVKGTPENGKNGGNQNLHDGRWDQAFHPQGRNRRTVWEIPLSKFRDTHFAVFPEKLVEVCILAGSQGDDVVLDPFMGSGTTALVAKRLRRKFIGIDCSERYCIMAESRLADLQATLAL